MSRGCRSPPKQIRIWNSQAAEVVLFPKYPLSTTTPRPARRPAHRPDDPPRRTGVLTFYARTRTPYSIQRRLGWLLFKHRTYDELVLRFIACHATLPPCKRVKLPSPWTERRSDKTSLGLNGPPDRTPPPPEVDKIPHARNLIDLSVQSYECGLFSTRQSTGLLLVLDLDSLLQDSTDDLHSALGAKAIFESHGLR